MKKYINILLPVSSLVIASSVITSCSCTTQSNIIPKECLKIEGTILKGFKQPQYKSKDSLGAYTVLTIPKEITYMEQQSFTPNLASEYDSPTVITRIDYELDCVCTNYSDTSVSGTNFNNLPNLETVIFPPKYSGTDTYLFNNCSKLKTIDLSNIESNLPDCFDLISEECGSPTGQIIIKCGKNQVAANQIKNTLGSGWTVVQKQ